MADLCRFITTRRDYCGLAAMILLLTLTNITNARDNDELAAIENDLNALGTRIQKLQDLAEVENIPRYYSYYVDKGQWRSVADLFAEDGVLEIGGRGRFLGRERAFEYLFVGFNGIGVKPGLLGDHQNFQPLVTIHEDGSTAEARVIALVMSNGGWGHVYYENDYVKEEGVWKISNLHAPFNMYASYSIGWVDNVILNTYPEKFPPPPDLLPSVMYLAYPSYYVEPFHYPNPVTGAPMPAHDPAAGGEAFGIYKRLD